MQFAVLFLTVRHKISNSKYGMSLTPNCSKILVVDDEPLVLSYISAILRRMGCANVVEAATAEEGGAHIQNSDVSLLISDITLPDGDGRGLAANLLDLKSDAVIVLITGFSTSDIALSPEIKDRVLLLEKPFTPDDVSALVGNFLKPASMPAHSNARSLSQVPLHAAA